MLRRKLVLAAFMAAGVSGYFSATLPVSAEVAGYDSAIDQGLYKYTPRFREMATFPPTEGVLDQAADLFAKDRGGQSCATCHGEEGERLKGVALEYPKYDAKIGKPKLLQHQINACLTGQMGQKALKWESQEQVFLVAFVKAQSNGMVMNYPTDGPMAPFIAAGKKSYEERIGHFDVACIHCHETAAGTNIRAEFMSPPDNLGLGQVDQLVAELPKTSEQEARLAAGATIGSGSMDHWPAYRLKWGKTASMQRRMRTCNKNVRAQPKPYGDDYYVNLEAYLATRVKGMPMNVPGIRP